MNTEEYWKQGRDFHRKGDLNQAIAHYRQALSVKVVPQSKVDLIQRIYADLGEAYINQGNTLEAIACFETIIQSDVQNLEAHWAIARLYESQGWQELALKHFGIALSLDPMRFELDTHLAIAKAWESRSNWQEAIAAYHRALKLGHFSNVYAALGKAYIANQQPFQAWSLFQATAEIDFELIPAISYNQLGVAFSTIVVLGTQVLGNAAACFRKAIEIKPDYADAHANLGNLFWQTGDLKNAILCFQEAIAIDPNFTQVYYNLGTILAELDRLEDSTLLLSSAIELDPKFADAHFNLGTALVKQNLIPEAIAAYQNTISLSQYHEKAHWNLGYALLLSGDFKQGWQEYDWRWRSPKSEFMPPRKYLQPVWEGSDLANQTLLIYDDQGYGDAIQLIRYASVIKQKCQKLIVECSAPLRRIFQSISEIDQVVLAGEPLPHFDQHIPMISLPRLLNTELDSIPNQVPYLSANQFSPLEIRPNTFPDNFKIGIVWASGFKTSSANQLKLYQQKSCPISYFLQLQEVANISLFSLQIGKDAAEINQFPNDRIADLSEYIKDFADTASLIQSLDLIITVDTAVAHLAGALGKPTWVLLPFASDWRWLINRTDSPWYPTLRLFRQPKAGDWNAVWEDIMKELPNLIIDLTIKPEK
jgi:tetratricopeptide (TPR) repeat protein